MPAPLIIRIVGDETSYLRAAENTVAANTKLDASFDKVGANAKRSADIQIAAAVRAHEALRANVTALRTAAASAPAGSREQIAATNLANVAQLRLARSTAVTSTESEKLAAGAKNAERDVGKLTRGLLAGSGAASAMGRSLAFASGSFIGIAAVSSAIREAVAGADELDKANRSIGVVLAHNNQQAGVTVASLDKWAKAQENLGVSQTEALTGLRETVVLTGSATKGMLAYRIGLELSRAENIDLDSALRIAGKAIQGQTTSLTRYGIILPKTTNAQQIFNAFQARFAKQAETNTSAFDRLRASYSNVATSVGTALLPVFEKYAASLADWLSKSTNQEKITRDVAAATRDVASVIRGLIGVVQTVDKVTGSFAHTLELLATIKLASWTANGILALRGLAEAFGLVKTAATAAEAAEVGAAAAGAGAGAAGAVEAGAASAGAGAVAAAAPVAAVTVGLGAIVAGTAAASFGNSSRFVQIKGHVFQVEVAGRGGRLVPVPDMTVGIPGSPVVLPSLLKGNNVPSFFPSIPGFPQPLRGSSGGSPGTSPGPFGSAQPISVFKSFSLTIPEQLAQARAALTKSTADDVTAAKQLVARIKRLIDEGHLSGASLIQALQSESSALTTIWSAEDAAAQSRAAAAQAAKQRIDQEIANAIDPLKLEVSLSRAEAFGKPVLPRLRALLAAAERGLAKAMAAHNLSLEKQALDQIASLKQQIQSAQTSTSVTFTAPAKLELALAKDAALGADQTKDLLKLRAAILKFIATHKKNIQAEIDAYNQLASVNQQLGQTAQTALGLFKQASTRALTAGLGLTAAQRKALRARLSQLGPGGTLPGQGTGAFGVVIGDNGRAIHVHTTVNLDGKKIAQNTTRHQQRRRGRNSTQRRGPNAGVPVSG